MGFGFLGFWVSGIGAGKRVEREGVDQGLVGGATGGGGDREGVGGASLPPQRGWGGREAVPSVRGMGGWVCGRSEGFGLIGPFFVFNELGFCVLRTSEERGDVIRREGFTGVARACWR